MAQDNLSKMDKLVAGLHSATQDGAIAWEPTVDEEKFQAAFPDYSIVIVRREFRPPTSVLSFLAVDDPRPRYEYIIEVRNATGVLVDEIFERDLKKGDRQNLLRDLFVEARRSASGSKAIDSILARLDDLAPAS